ncbi:MAG: hypothetical protein KBD78_04485 [Oligoflexales bacterium]|nr:hypothetical protein [Oligoflexales bacterium]
MINICSTSRKILPFMTTSILFTNLILISCTLIKENAHPPIPDVEVADEEKTRKKLVPQEQNTVNDWSGRFSRRGSSWQLYRNPDNTYNIAAELFNQEMWSNVLKLSNNGLEIIDDRITFDSPFSECKFFLSKQDIILTVSNDASCSEFGDALQGEYILKTSISE